VDRVATIVLRCVATTLGAGFAVIAVAVALIFRSCGSASCDDGSDISLVGYLLSCKDRGSKVSEDG
jgi:hypothetical protein